MPNLSKIKDELNFNQNEIKFLKKLAICDRKRFVVASVLDRKNSIKTINSLMDRGIIRLEKSSEIKPKSQKHRKIKKDLRRYNVQDKFHFCSNFLRFWFYFIEPNYEILEQNEVERFLQILQNEYEKFASLAYELASLEFLSDFLGVENSHFSSFWTKDVEIDIFANLDGFIIVGEVKFRDRKVCKNLLNSLKFKCQKAGISPNLIVIFSRFGFSLELKNLENEGLNLFDINDFQRLR